MLCNLNHAALSKILGKQLILFELPNARLKSPTAFFNAFRGHIDGLTTQTIDRLIKLIQSEDVRQVFVDGSNLGGFISRLKYVQPQVEVITFFHNVEARFFWGALKSLKTPRSLAVFVVNYLAERKAACLSDKRICLSERDSQLLKKIYGQSATHIAPIALVDKHSGNAIDLKMGQAEPFALFVGGNFYANRDGIAWFVKNVARRIDIKVCIVGNGMDDMRAKLEIPGRVEVIGVVDNLAKWYRGARFVIAPIFEGSGMKTKVAEALMHGKKVVGTPEAFAGYEDIAEAAGWRCASADEFVEAIQAAQHTIDHHFDPVLRKLYEEKYSLPAATARLAKAISADAGDIGQNGLKK